MWLFTRYGFFSAVQSHTSPDEITVRARVRKDLDALRRGAAGALGPTTHTTNTDYPYRANISRANWSATLAALGQDLDYTNFKAMVEATQGKARHDLYSEVWRTMYDAEETLRQQERTRDPTKCQCLAGHVWRAKDKNRTSCPQCGRFQSR